jgi:hypothetical protein
MARHATLGNGRRRAIMPLEAGTGEQSRAAAVATVRATSKNDREMAMGWVLLAIGAAAVAGAITVLRSGGRAHQHSGVMAHRPRSRAERVERPHRQVAHYRASGALPRWES